MQQRPNTDPTSWIYQANIHGVPSGTTLRPAWRTCDHGTWYFFPWHRMYIFYFERVLQQGVSYLDNFHYEVLSGWTADARLLALDGEGLRLIARTGSGHTIVMDNGEGDSGPRPATQPAASSSR